MTILQLGDNLRTVGLFEGYGGLSEGLRMILGGELVAYAEYEPPTKKTPRPTQAAARLLGYRYPGIPNLGDVSTIDWSPWAGKVDVMCGGFPCQDVSHAGLGGGLQIGNRSGLWFQFARAINETRPPLVLIENVPGLRSAPTGSSKEVTDDDETDVDDSEADSGTAAGDSNLGGTKPVRPGPRAFSAVCSSLATLGYDSQWTSVRASDVGAPHKRERVFILAYADELTEIRPAT